MEKSDGWWKKTAYILFIPIFSYFILSKELYRHHLLALILGLIDVIILNGCIFPLGFSISGNTTEVSKEVQRLFFKPK